MTITGRAPAALATGAVCAGLAVIVVGTFLPWLESGRATRDSYASDGLLRRLVDPPGPLAALLALWPYLSLACALAAALALLGLRRTGPALAAGCALVAGAVSGTVLAAAGGGPVRPALAGPVVTLSGAVLVLLTVLVRAGAMISTRSTRSVRPARSVRIASSAGRP